MKKKICLVVICAVTFFISDRIFAQEIKSKDSIPEQMLDSIFVSTYLHASNASYLPDLQGMHLYAGKKTNELNFSSSTPGLAQNLARTALAKIPGLTIWEMDGAGTQLNIGSRGTDAHRSIEMNMRQNGYCTNSDMFGYPENHYTVPMQAVQQIQLVRGSAALQFGPQFGGMLNLKLKQGDSTKPLAVEAEQTAGSNSFFNSYNAVGGTKGKWNYYAYYDFRHGDGWRDNATFNYHAYYAHLAYAINKKMTIAAEFSRMDYIQQIAGGLTDAQFYADAKQSFRSRNFFQPAINIPALTFHYNISANTQLEVISNAIFGQRNSVQFINAGNIMDTINTALGTYNPRQVDRDYYTGFTTEARLLHQYSVGSVHSILVAGLRYFNEQTKRRQKGVGTTGSNFDLSLIKPYGIDLKLHTTNYAAFAENTFYIGTKFSVTPGVRYEIIDTKLDGVINNATDAVYYTGKRNFPLFGMGLQYNVNSSTQLYGNISQAYRPYLYANVTPADRIDKIDPSLKDSKGYDIDLGYRGHIQNVFQFDVNVFRLFYGNRVGLLSETDAGGNNYLFTTNIGNSVAKGVEAYVELSILKLLQSANRNTDLRIFHSLAFDDARYTTGTLNSGGTNKDIEGNFVENAPQWINKTGLQFRYKTFSTNLQFSSTSKSYNDAQNTISSSNGVTGLIPAWHVFDINAYWQINTKYHLSFAINNFTNEHYFNRRITFYPGPGILPADGRTFNISFGLNL